MPDIINLLPDSIANQIAAGEVIQRPASVIKELVENAIDAGATKIAVIVKDAGRTLIQVSDNGKGMSHTDARMAFERHATSKISSADDIFRLQTMGFRGEALASIAAVASVELRTKQENQDFGTLIEISGSQIIKHEAESCAKGTTFSVKNLFFNVPARRKFLKSDDTEMRHIISEFHRVALANPDIAFTLYSGTTPVYETVSENMKQRIASIFGKNNKKYTNSLIAIKAETSIVKISGFVGNPSSAMRNAPQFLFVNKRFMKHPYFNKAILNAYANMLPKDTYPIYFINFEVDPKSIDVNVHPTKTEIKFEDEREIFAILLASVRESLGKFNFAPSIDFEHGDSAKSFPVYSADNKTFANMPKPTIDPSYNPFSRPYGGKEYDRKNVVDRWKNLYEEQNKEREQDENISQKIIFDNQQNNSAFFVYKEKYLVSAVKSGLMIVDMQKAIERIVFEEIIIQLQQSQIVTQKELFPNNIDLSVDEQIVFQSILPDLKNIGFELNKVSDSIYSIDGIPAILSDISNTDQVIKDILAYVSDCEIDIEMEIYEKIALKLAKNNAKYRYKKISSEEYDTLIANLFQCNMPNITPDGEKILVILSDNDIWGNN